MGYEYDTSLSEDENHRRYQNFVAPDRGLGENQNWKKGDSNQVSGLWDKLRKNSSSQDELSYTPDIMEGIDTTKENHFGYLELLNRREINRNLFGEDSEQYRYADGQLKKEFGIPYKK